MSISFAGMVAARPYGTYNGMLLPLVLRNSNTTNSKDKDKNGPSVVVKFGPRDYRMWFEGLNSTNFAPQTNFEWHATSPDGYTWTKNSTTILDPQPVGWEAGEVCFSTVLWNPDSRGGEFWAYYHGGNNAGPRAIGIMTSPTALPGTWQRYGASPVLTKGASGDFDGNGCSDAAVIRIAKGDWRMLYTGFRVSDGRMQVGYATSRDGKFWTKSASNPVLPFGTGNESTGVSGVWPYVDELGRVHCWYNGQAADGFTYRIFYAYSDNWTSWTRDGSVIVDLSATSTDPDAGAVGDVVHGIVDDGELILTSTNFNMSTYSGDALGRLEGRGVYRLPKLAAVTPKRPARWIRRTENSYVAAPSASAVTSQNIFSVYGEFKCFIDRTPSVQRTLYNEDEAFNQMLRIELNASGSFKNSLFFRTTSGIMSDSFSTTPYDDNQYHWFLFRRTSATAFELVVDGTSLGTATIVGGTNVPTDVTIGGVTSTNSNYGGGLTAGAGGIVRRIVTISGYAMTNTEAATIWNNGNDGGALPVSGTLKLNLKLGSGGTSGPDVDLSANAYSCTVVNSGTGAVLVDGGIAGNIQHNHYVNPRGRRTRR